MLIQKQQKNNEKVIKIIARELHSVIEKLYFPWITNYFCLMLIQKQQKPCKNTTDKYAEARRKERGRGAEGCFSGVGGGVLNTINRIDRASFEIIENN